MGAKLVAKKHASEMVIQPWSDDDLALMSDVLRMKTIAYPDLARQLIATGDATIIEDCTNRPNGSGLFWGAALQNGMWVGQNQLGKLWMSLRQELITGPI